jgi:PTH1 family peptidyl-tRNA hydrolase
MRVIVGLGNPGSQYAGSRHNLGFAVVEEVSRRWRLPLGRARHGLRMATGSVAGQHVALIEPQMYMNVSGPALARAGQHIEAKRLIVVHDDLDLELGSVRVKCGGGTAGHHGLDSIVECYGRDFVRVRVGVGRPPRGEDGIDYVLSRFHEQEREDIAAAVSRAADAVECIITEGQQAAMNTFNVRPHKRPPLRTEPVGRN